jgi:hypothetical protein
MAPIANRRQHCLLMTASRWRGFGFAELANDGVLFRWRHRLQIGASIVC